MEEHINKLSQLDRIEYRIKEVDINANLRTFVTSSLLMMMVFITGMISLLNYAILNGKLEDATRVIIPIIIIGTFLVIGYVVYVFIIWVNENKKLNKEYFDTVIKQTQNGNLGSSI